MVPYTMGSRTCYRPAAGRFHPAAGRLSVDAAKPCQHTKPREEQESLL